MDKTIKNKTNIPTQDYTEGVCICKKKCLEMVIIYFFLNNISNSVFNPISGHK